MSQDLTPAQHIAYLQEIREPSEAMRMQANYVATHPDSNYIDIFRAMIDALIAERGKKI